MSEQIKLEGIITAAVAWWNQLCPSEWSRQDHIRNPIVNTQSDAEKKLALAVANHIKRKLRDSERNKKNVQAK